MSKAPKLGVASFDAPKKVKAGKSAKIAIEVENTGGAVATGAKVCLAVKGKAKAKPECPSLGKIQPGRSKSATTKLKTKKKAKGKLSCRRRSAPRTPRRQRRRKRFGSRRPGSRVGLRIWRGREVSDRVTQEAKRPSGP